MSRLFCPEFVAIKLLAKIKFLLRESEINKKNTIGGACVCVCKCVLKKKSRGKKIPKYDNSSKPVTGKTACIILSH